MKTEPFRGVTANVTAFDTDIKDFQAQVVNAGVGVLRGYLANAEKVRVRGVEFDGSARVNRHLSFYGATAYTDGKYVSFPDAPPPLEDTGGPQVKDISGSVLPGISEWALSVGGAVRPSGDGLGRTGEFFGAFDASYRSSFSSSASASRYLVVDGYSLLNARVGFRWADGWTLIAVVAQSARQAVLRVAHRGAWQHRALRRSAGRRPNHRSDYADPVRGQVAGDTVRRGPGDGRIYPVFLIPAATPLMVTSSARRSHTVSSALASRASRRRRSSSTCRRLIGST